MKMELVYASTRDAQERVTASQAILRGLANDGGLFVPTQIPALDVPMEELGKMSYQETAYEVMKRFLTDFTEEELIPRMTASSTQRRSHRLWRRTAHITWNCSTVPRSLLRIWHCPFCRIC